MTTRDEFEQWVNSYFCMPNLLIDADGKYSAGFMQDKWECWQAATKLQIPEIEPARLETLAGQSFINGRLNYVRYYKAIRQELNTL